MMGAIIEKDGIKLSIYTSDHEPPHIHACKAGSTAKIEIQSLKATNYNMKKQVFKTSHSFGVFQSKKVNGGMGSNPWLK